MKEIKEIKIDDDKIYLRKIKNTYKVVYPFQKQYNNGKINWKNLIAGSSWVNLLKIGFIVIVILGCIYEYSNAVKIANECLNNNMLEIMIP